MKFKYFNRLDGSFSAVNICVLTPLRALTRWPRSLPARMVNCAVKLDCSSELNDHVSIRLYI